LCVAGVFALVWEVVVGIKKERREVTNKKRKMKRHSHYKSASEFMNNKLFC